MPFVPDFMVRTEEYEREKHEVRDVSSWAAFARKWFPTAAWPRKQSEDAATIPRVGKPLWLGGRTWRRVSYSYDITPEARYEFIYTKCTVGDPVKFPHERNSRRTSSDGWRHECPYCQIETSDPGDELCPSCGRTLVFTRATD